MEVDEELNIHILKTAKSQDNVINIKNYASMFRILFNASFLSPELSEKALEILANSNYGQGIRAGISDKSIVVADKYGKRDEKDRHGKLWVKQLHNIGIVNYPGKPYLLGIIIKGSDKTTMLKFWVILMPLPLMRLIFKSRIFRHVIFIPMPANRRA